MQAAVLFTEHLDQKADPNQKSGPEQEHNPDQKPGPDQSTDPGRTIATRTRRPSA